jgi:uncharacterized membrane protein
MTFYLLFKMIHICAVIIFLGNIITGLFWMRHAVNSNNRLLISHTMKGIIQSDKWFTIPGVIIITAGGILAAIHGHYPILKTGWIFWSIFLFAVSGIVFAWKVAPLQQKIYKMTREAPDGEKGKSEWRVFIKQYKAWELWGAIALATPLAALALMILKVPATTFFLKG